MNVRYLSTQNILCSLILYKSLRVEIYAYKIALFLMHCMGVKLGPPLKEGKVVYECLRAGCWERGSERRRRKLHNDDLYNLCVSGNIVRDTNGQNM
jgi:hypothetical protein